jgi:tRNA dimethylallyltransferase
VKAKPVLFIVGPTATGKSKIAVEIARCLQGEIISADSMLVYKGMDIGTAKPSKIERKNIPHHLIDLFQPSKNFSVFEYRKRALRKINEIQSRGKLPIVAGGTGLYVRALLRGLDPQPPADPKLRRQLVIRAKREGLENLVAELRKRNPERALKIKPTDERRIIRALEVLESSKKPAPHEPSLESLGFTPVVIGITKDRLALYEDIEKRVDGMFRRGLVQEVKKLARQKLSRTARQAVGYKEVLAALNGGYSLKEAQEIVKKNSRHLAKRQWTWFRREAGLQWVSWESGDNVTDMAKKALQIAGFKPKYSRK